jgi:phospholipid-binding lipoprotein MlaA
MMCWAKNLAMAVLLCGAAGCATVGSDPRDPMEPINRAMFSFNEGFDEAIGKPVATAYRDMVPSPARMAVRNFFANLQDLWIGANNLMQGKPLDALTDWTRFAMNSTFGLFGLLDFASEVGIEKHDEDFGQTMGRWGVDEGAYVVWPLLGSSTVRDSIGLIPDFHFDLVLRHKPVRVRNAMTVLRGVSKRADLLDASRILEEAALDKYVFQRDAYLQRRRSQVYDGNPPRAEREVPRAEFEELQPAPASASAPAPAAAIPAAAPETPAMPLSQRPTPEALEAAARLLESPASLSATHGG